MLCQIALSTVLAGSPVFITSVKTVPGHDVVAVEIAGESPLDATTVRGDISSGRLNLRLRDTRVHSDNRLWGEGTSLVRAHRHTGHTELDVALPSGDACSGPVKVVATAAGGLRATVACPGVKAASAPIAAPQVAPVPVDNARLLAALALESAAEVSKAPAVVPAAAPMAKVVTKDSAPAQAAAPAQAVAPAQAAAPAPSAAAESSASSWRVVVVPVGALILLGVVSLFLGKRRKANGRLVTILETASLGPKRALIVARVNGETLVLGSSEAGITLLRSRVPESPIGVDVDMSGPDEPPLDVRGRFRDASDEAGQDSPGQVRFLARLFGRKDKPEGEVEPWNFEGLLEDSIEDQELRRKLSSGFGVRVP